MNQALNPGETALIQEFDLGSARGGKAGVNRAPLEVEVVRPLTAEDLPAILNPPPVAAPGQVVKSIRHSHHQLAQLLAEGKSGAEISLVTGYSQAYISTLQGDPAFEELISYYTSQREEIFVDVQTRLRGLGLDAAEKLHEHLHDPQKAWSHRELMDVIKMALPAETGVKAAPQGSPSLTINGGNAPIEVKFVGAPGAQGPAVDGQFKDITPSKG